MRSNSLATSAACLAWLLSLGSLLLAQGTAAQNYLIGPQDVLMITCHEEPSMTGHYTVEADGTFTFPNLGTIKAEKLTVKQLEDILNTRLGPAPKGIEFFVNPHLTVAVETYKSQKVILMGPVGRPGSYPLTGGMTLLELIAQAGSLTASASGEVVIIRDRQDVDGKKQDPDIRHADLSRVKEGGTDGNILLQADDRIVVSEAGRAYILGEVKNAGAFPVIPGTQVQQLLALAGGATADGAQNRIRIERTVNGKLVKLDKVKLSDIVKPGDTVIVPTKFM